MKKLFQSVGLCIALVLTAPSMAFELKHNTGTIKSETTPKRIVSYDLLVLDNFNALGIEVVGVPKSIYKDDLAKFNDLPQIGTLFEPDYDVLKDLKPDLIFVGSRSQAATPQLEELAPTANLTNQRISFLKDFRENTLALAAAFDKTKEAEEGLARIGRNIEELQKINAGKTAAFLFVHNGNIMTHVEGDRFGFTFEMTGLKPVLPGKTTKELANPRPEPNSPAAKAATKKREQQINDIVKADPDWLFVFDKGPISGGEKTAEDVISKHPGLSQTTAFKTAKVIYVDPPRWYLITGGLNNLKLITDDLLAKMK
ncbi:Petrobactin-binding protein YclQ [Oligella sp. MSHR50489EDL]|uniref:ABC transporter substrate-binding protein n=1 Tax=Oligella sp. MSHR50489EDL TaxID=3139409 RepID=UPI003D817962